MPQVCVLEKQTVTSSGTLVVKSVIIKWYLNDSLSFCPSILNASKEDKKPNSLTLEVVYKMRNLLKEYDHGYQFAVFYKKIKQLQKKNVWNTDVYNSWESAKCDILVETIK